MKKQLISIFLATAILTACNPNQQIQNVKSASDITSASDVMKGNIKTESILKEGETVTVPMSIKEIENVLAEFNKLTDYKQESLWSVLKVIPINQDVEKALAGFEQDFTPEQQKELNSHPLNKKIMKALFALSLYEKQLSMEGIKRSEAQNLIDNEMQINEYKFSSLINFPLKGTYDKADTPLEKQVLATLKSNLNKIYKEKGITDTVKINSVKEFFVKGLYVVFANDNPNPMITNEKGEYFIVLSQDPQRGKLSMLLGNDLETLSWDNPQSQNVYKDIVSHLNPSIKHVFGKGERSIYVFSDPDCPYCRAQDLELHEKLTPEDNVTVYQVMNPIQNLHPMAFAKAAHLMCLPDPSGEWLKMQKNGGEVTHFSTQGYNNAHYKGKDIKKCLDDVTASKMLADVIGFRVTPSMITGDGVVMLYRHSVNDIRKVLNEKVQIPLQSQ